MTPDLFTRAALAVVALSLILLVAQGFGLTEPPAGSGSEVAPAAGPAAATAEAPSGQFTFVPLPMARVVFRFNRETGEAWKMPVTGGSWIAVREAGVDPAETERSQTTLDLPGDLSGLLAAQPKADGAPKRAPEAAQETGSSPE